MRTPRSRPPGQRPAQQGPHRRMLIVTFFTGSRHLPLEPANKERKSSLPMTRAWASHTTPRVGRPQSTPRSTATAYSSPVTTGLREGNAVSRGHHRPRPRKSTPIEHAFLTRSWLPSALCETACPSPRQPSRTFSAGWLRPRATSLSRHGPSPGKWPPAKPHVPGNAAKRPVPA